MRPIKLMGHERPLSQVKYNKDGDLILTVSKDLVASVWFSHNGERLGTLSGHKGAINTVDIDNDSKVVATGAADFKVMLWNCQTGECFHTWEMPTPVVRLEISQKNDKIAIICDEVMGLKGTITVYPFTPKAGAEQSDKPFVVITNTEESPKATVIGWSYGDKYLITGHDNGMISKYDSKTGELLQREQIHEVKFPVTDIQFSVDRTYFITSSKDKTAKLTDVETLQVLKNYVTDAPVNSAAITPVKDFVILGGGQDARDVTTTSSKLGKFEARIFHKIFEDDIGRVKGHFGPLNYVAIHPKGTGFTSGGEDGMVRVHHFDKSFFDFKYEVERSSTIV